MNLIQLTKWYERLGDIETIHGNICYYKWCCNEVMRIKKDKSRIAKVLINPKNKNECSVWCNDIGDNRGDDYKSVTHRSHMVVNKRLGVKKGRYGKRKGSISKPPS